jgi:hypothetical protein
MGAAPSMIKGITGDDHELIPLIYFCVFNFRECIIGDQSERDYQ